MVSRSLSPFHSLLSTRFRYHSSLATSASHRSHTLFHRQKCCLYTSLPHGPLKEPSQPDLSSFNDTIRHLSHQRSFSDALHVYASIFRHGHRPNGSTLALILKPCTALLTLPFGRSVHAHIVLLGFHASTFIQNGVIVMYSRFNELITAHQVFDLLSFRNVVSWTSLLSGYAQNGFPLQALQIFRTMRLDSSVIPDFIALVSVLKAYTDVGELGQGRSLHGLVVKFGLDGEPDLLITLTAMYAKSGQVHTARSMFDQVVLPDVILWNTMISGYAKNGHAEEAVELFKMMIAKKVNPDSITVTSAILAFAQVGSLEAARWISDLVNHTRLKNDVFVQTAIIDMYAKCGSVDFARKVFDNIPHKDVVAWSAMIMGYGLFGQGEEAICLFHEMNRARVSPNDVTFVGLLSACKNAGLVEEGRKYFALMKDHAVEPRHQHYACIVDLLARAGHLEEAYEFIKGMPMTPEITVWGALLNACRIHGHVELGKYAAECIFAIEPWNAGHYVQLSNIYASVGLWKEVASLRVMMKDRRVTKALGLSSIEINGKLQSFYAGDKSHPRSTEIFAMMNELEASFTVLQLD